MSGDALCWLLLFKTVQTNRQHHSNWKTNIAQCSSQFGRTMILGRAYGSFGWLWVEAAGAYETLKYFSSARKVGGGRCELLRVLRITTGKHFFTSSRNSRCVRSGYASDRSWQANRLTRYFERVFHNWAISHREATFIFGTKGPLGRPLTFEDHPSH